MLDKNGEPCPPGVVGRLALKGPTGCRYLADERQKEYVANGRNITGDAYHTETGKLQRYLLRAPTATA